MMLENVDTAVKIFWEKMHFHTISIENQENTGKNHPNGFSYSSFTNESRKKPVSLSNVQSLMVMLHH